MSGSDSNDSEGSEGVIKGLAELEEEIHQLYQLYADIGIDINNVCVTDIATKKSLSLKNYATKVVGKMGKYRRIAMKTYMEKILGSAVVAEEEVSEGQSETRKRSRPDPSASKSASAPTIKRKKPPVYVLGGTQSPYRFRFIIAFVMASNDPAYTPSEQMRQAYPACLEKLADYEDKKSAFIDSIKRFLPPSVVTEKPCSVDRAIAGMSTMSLMEAMQREKDKKCKWDELCHDSENIRNDGISAEAAAWVMEEYRVLEEDSKEFLQMIFLFDILAVSIVQRRPLLDAVFKTDRIKLQNSIQYLISSNGGIPGFVAKVLRDEEMLKNCCSRLIRLTLPGHDFEPPPAMDIADVVTVGQSRHMFSLSCDDYRCIFESNSAGSELRSVLIPLLLFVSAELDTLFEYALTPEGFVALNLNALEAFGQLLVHEFIWEYKDSRRVDFFDFYYPLFLHALSNMNTEELRDKEEVFKRFTDIYDDERRKHPDLFTLDPYMQALQESVPLLVDRVIVPKEYRQYLPFMRKCFLRKGGITSLRDFMLVYSSIAENERLERIKNLKHGLLTSTWSGQPYFLSTYQSCPVKDPDGRITEQFLLEPVGIEEPFCFMKVLSEGGALTVCTQLERTPCPQQQEGAIRVATDDFLTVTFRYYQDLFISHEPYQTFMTRVWLVEDIIKYKLNPAAVLELKGTGKGDLLAFYLPGFDYISILRVDHERKALFQHYNVYIQMYTNIQDRCSLAFISFDNEEELLVEKKSCFFLMVCSDRCYVVNASEGRIQTALQGLVSRTRSLKTYNSVIYRSGAIVIDNAAYDFESGFIIPTNVEMEIDSVLPTLLSCPAGHLCEADTYSKCKLQIFHPMRKGVKKYRCIPCGIECLDCMGGRRSFRLLSPSRELSDFVREYLGLLECGGLLKCGANISTQVIELEKNVCDEQPAQRRLGACCIRGHLLLFTELMSPDY